MAQSALIAVGGNSLIRAGGSGGDPKKADHLRRTASAIVELLRDGLHVVVTHGNGPQVGAALLRSEIAAGRAYSQSLDLCDASTQGEIGYEIAQAIENELARAGLSIPVAPVITQTVVRPDDPAFLHPSKPIGMFYTREEMEQKVEMLGWTMVYERNRGYRRAVPSPNPVEIVEIESLRRLIATGTLVVAAGGGGIPVVRTEDGLHGVEAVIDKDLASSLLATQLGMDMLMITTDVECVYADHGTLMERPILSTTIDELEQLRRQGQFPPGSMGPKVEAVIRFLRAGGKRAAITNCEHLHAAIHGMAGTQVVASGESLPAMRDCEDCETLAVRASNEIG
jgi:carbamate kinase